MSRLAYFRNIKLKHVSYHELLSFSVIIPIYEEPRYIPDELVNGLINTIYPTDEFEVAVVDDSDVKTLIDYNYSVFRRIREHGIWLKYIWHIKRTGYRGRCYKRGYRGSQQRLCSCS